ncbi:MAG TPA: hypothetical protein VFW33_00100 [Gemmataceae bacterium]|nr:hypothetical protein [Gemmataceae bacterium]
MSEKLGRPAHCRKVRNRQQWYVSDPVFSFVQHGMKKGDTGYRVGFMVDMDVYWFSVNGKFAFGVLA